MRRAFLIAVYLVVGGCTLATAASTTPAVVVSDRTAYVLLHQKPELVKVSAAKGEKQAASVAPTAAGANPKAGNTGAPTYGSLLATLVLMCAIAFRRYWSVKR